jgi:hypothetical protein
MNVLVCVCVCESTGLPGVEDSGFVNSRSSGISVHLHQHKICLVRRKKNTDVNQKKRTATPCSSSSMVSRCVKYYQASYQSNRRGIYLKTKNTRPSSKHGVINIHISALTFQYSICH